MPRKNVRGRPRHCCHVWQGPVQNTLMSLLDYVWRVFLREKCWKNEPIPSVHFVSIQQVIGLRGVRLHHRTCAANKVVRTIRWKIVSEIPNSPFFRFKPFCKMMTTQGWNIIVYCFSGRKHETCTRRAHDSARDQICVRKRCQCTTTLNSLW